MAQLTTTSFNFFTSAVLINAQSNLRLLRRQETLRENIENRVHFLSVLTGNPQEDMDEPTKKLHDSYQDFLHSLKAVVDKD